jgi:Mlc titration factor MtfA (ptsG expression regulator)
MIPTDQRIASNRKYAAVIAVSLAVLCIMPTLIFARSITTRWVVIGVTVLVAWWVYRFGTRIMRRRVKLLTKPFPAQWRAVFQERVAFFGRLTDEEKDRFCTMSQIFLDEKPITPVKCEIDQTVRLLVAASAVIPVFSLPNFEYDMLGEVLIYPNTFDATVQQNSSGPLMASGMVGTQGTFGGLMVLSKRDLLRGFEIHGDKHNVGIHEFAHLLDKADGSVDGIPPLPFECVRPWQDIVRKELSRYVGDSDIPRYGFTNRQEFFAVVSEYFFESPKKLAEKHPEVYELLKRAFSQDTRKRFSGIAKGVIRFARRRTGRNSPCPCGSGKKYKKCCLK